GLGEFLLETLAAGQIPSLAYEDDQRAAACQRNLPQASQHRTFEIRKGVHRKWVPRGRYRYVEHRLSTADRKAVGDHVGGVGIEDTAGIEQPEERPWTLAPQSVALAVQFRGHGQDSVGTGGLRRPLEFGRRQRAVRIDEDWSTDIELQGACLEVQLHRRNREFDRRRRGGAEIDVGDVGGALEAGQHFIAQVEADLLSGSPPPGLGRRVDERLQIVITKRGDQTGWREYRGEIGDGGVVAAPRLERIAVFGGRLADRQHRGLPYIRQPRPRTTPGNGRHLTEDAAKQRLQGRGQRVDLFAQLVEDRLWFSAKFENVAACGDKVELRVKRLQCGYDRAYLRLLPLCRADRLVKRLEMVRHGFADIDDPLR